MRRALSLGSVRLALVVGAALGAGLSALPLLGTLGVESALVLGIVLPPFALSIGVRVVARARLARVQPRAGELLGAAVGWSLASLGVATTLVALNGWRVGACAPLEGLAFIALGPGFGVTLAATLGVLVGAIVTRPRVANALAVLVWVLAVAAGFARFYGSPAIYVYSHLVGWFPGTIYDESVGIRGQYLTLRIVTAIAIGGVAAFLAATFEAAGARIVLGHARSRPVAAAGALVLLALAGVADLHAEDLGHASSAASITERLGGHAEGRRCTVVAPRELDRASQQRLAADCDFRIETAERWLGVTHPERITAFIFRSTDEKRELMGAAETYIAKPWRNEVYLQVDQWPHPVLAHEIAHVVAGSVGPGPFRIAGGGGGLWPNPGLIEGLAVAIAWSPREDLTPHQWALAMQRIGVAPPLGSVLGTSFLLGSASRSYTVAGSFVRWVWQTRGAAAVRRLYATGDVAGTLGAPLPELERQWRAFLATQTLDADALAMARVRFAGGGIFADVCPHRVAVLEGQLAGDLAAGDDSRAIGTCRDVLDIDPTAHGTRAALAGALARVGRTADAQREIDTLERRFSAPTPYIAAANQALADAAWRRGDRTRARTLYDALLGAPMSDDDRRVLEVKRLGLDAGPPVDRLLFDLLVGDGGHPPDGAIVVHLAREIAAARRDGLGAYLEARQLYQRDRYDLAAPLLARARHLMLPSARLSRESRRMEAAALFATGELAASRALWASVAADSRSSAAARAEATDWLARIRHTPP